MRAALNAVFAMLILTNFDTIFQASTYPTNVVLITLIIKGSFYLSN